MVLLAVIRKLESYLRRLTKIFFDALQEELCAIIEGAGLIPKKGSYGQVLTALKLLLQPINGNLTAFSEVAGAADRLAYFTAEKALAATPLTSVGHTILSKSTAAEILAAISGAPLSSPVFTGAPKAPTPAATSNDTQIATSAFVKAVISSLLLGTASQRSVGTSTNQIPDMGSFASLRSVNGYQTLPGGLLVQWGTVSMGSSTSVSAIFPIAFTSQVFGIQVTDTGAANITYGTSARSTTGFTLSRGSSNGTAVASYFAYGI